MMKPHRHRTGIAFAAAVAVLAAESAFACSGPGAARSIAHNQMIGMASFLIGVVTIMPALGYYFAFPFSKAAPVMYALFLGFHPAIWISARLGDCGRTLRYTSLFFLGASLASLCIELARRDARKAGLTFPRQITTRTWLLFIATAGLLAFFAVLFEVRDAESIGALVLGALLVAAILGFLSLEPLQPKKSV